MRNQIFYVLTMCLFAWMPLQAETPTHLVKVTADRVNLRAGPSLQAEVVSQAAQGDILVARSFRQEWVEVAPDENVHFWVHSEFVDNGEVKATKLNIRAGAGINYSIVGSLTRGDRVEVKETFGEWLKIVPPYGSSLWVNFKLVELLKHETTDEPETKTAVTVPQKKPRKVKKLPPRVPTPSVDTSKPAPPPPQGMVLVPLDGQGNRVQKEGVLRKVGILFGKPADFRLVLASSTHTETICYVRGNKSQLESFLGRRLIIKGPQYWVQGARFPVVIPEQIIPQTRP